MQMLEQYVVLNLLVYCSRYTKYQPDEDITKYRVMYADSELLYESGELL